MQTATLCELLKKSKHFITTSGPSQYLRSPHLADGMYTFSMGDGTAARERSTAFSYGSSVRCALDNVSGIAVNNTLLVGYT